MNIKWVSVFFLSLILYLVFFKIDFFIKPLKAQQQVLNTNQIPSDLSLDLEFAQQNPAPEQAQIVKNEVKEAIVSNGTSTTIIKPEEKLAPEVKYEPNKEVVHPDQKTSEQIIITEVKDNSGVKSEPSSPPSSPIDNASPLPSSSADNTIINNNQDIKLIEPDDNAAPAEQMSSPTTSPDNQSSTLPSPSSSDNSLNTNTSSNNPSGIGISGSSQSTPAPTTTDNSGGSSNPPPTPTQAPVNNDSSNSNSSSSSNSSSDNTTSGGTQSTPSDSSQNSTDQINNSDSSLVQGVSKGPNIFQRIINFLLGRSK